MAQSKEGEINKCVVTSVASDALLSRGSALAAWGDLGEHLGDAHILRFENTQDMLQILSESRINIFPGDSRNARIHCGRCQPVSSWPKCGEERCHQFLR